MLRNVLQTETVKYFSYHGTYFRLYTLINCVFLLFTSTFNSSVKETYRVSKGNLALLQRKLS